MTTTKFYTSDGAFAVEVFININDNVAFDITDVKDPENDSMIPCIALTVEDAKGMIKVLKELTKAAGK